MTPVFEASLRANRLLTVCQADKAVITRQIGGVFYRRGSLRLPTEYADQRQEFSRSCLNKVQPSGRSC